MLRVLFRHYMAIGLLLLLLMILTSQCALHTDVGSADTFTLIEIPSSFHDHTILVKQIQWIKNNVEAEHIDFVVHLGDLVPFKYTEDDWKAAGNSLRQLDAIVPYFVLSGNHDIFPGTGRHRERNYDLFRHYFPISTKWEYSCFGGSYEGSEDNAYFIFSKNNIELLVLCLEFAPREEILE